MKCILTLGVVLAMVAGTVASGMAQSGNATGTTNTGTAVTGATGTITQWNYGSDGGVEGFLIGTTTLLTFPMNVCGGLSGLGVVGDAVTYTGTAFTAPSGFQTVRVTSFTNNATAAAYTAPTLTSTTYGPASGALKQLNYGSDGSVNGFVFTPTGSTTSLFVSTGSRASSTLTPLLEIAASVSVAGTTFAAKNACSSTGNLETINASSLTIGSQTIVIPGGGNGGGRNSGPGGPGGAFH